MKTIYCYTLAKEVALLQNWSKIKILVFNHTFTTASKPDKEQTFSKRNDNYKI